MKPRIQAPGVMATLFALLGIGGERQQYNAELSELVVPVVQINPPNITNNVTQFGDAWTTNGEAYIGRFNVAPVAANFGAAQIANPAGSGVDIYIDTLRIGATVTQETQIKYGVTTAMVAANWIAGSKDMTPGPAMKASLGSNQQGGYNGTQIWGVQGGDGTLKTFNPPIRLAPGNSLTIVDSTANETLYGAMEWREVPRV